MELPEQGEPLLPSITALPPAESFYSCQSIVHSKVIGPRGGARGTRVSSSSRVPCSFSLPPEDPVVLDCASLTLDRPIFVIDTSQVDLAIRCFANACCSLLTGRRLTSTDSAPLWKNSVTPRAAPFQPLRRQPVKWNPSISIRTQYTFVSVRLLFPLGRVQAGKTGRPTVSFAAGYACGFDQAYRE